MRARVWSSLAGRGCRRCLQADPAGSQAAQLPAGGDAAAQADRAARSSPATRSRRWPTRPDEVFIMLSLAGASAYVWSWKIGIAVAMVMIAVVASYRQTVHAYPSGGGDYEVATVNLGATAGATVASALLVDYVLTVAVSISSGAQYAASAVGVLSGHEALLRLGDGGRADGDQPARDPRVRHLLRLPHLRVHDRDPRHVRLRDAAARDRRPAAGGERRPRHRAGARLRAAPSRPSG